MYMTGHRGQRKTSASICIVESLRTSLSTHQHVALAVAMRCVPSWLLMSGCMAFVDGVYSATAQPQTTGLLALAAFRRIFEWHRLETGCKKRLNSSAAQQRHPDRNILGSTYSHLPKFSTRTASCILHTTNSLLDTPFVQPDISLHLNIAV